MGKNILIVEDEKPMAEALRVKLSREGFQVTVAGDGDQARSLTKAEKYDLIITDLLMPKFNGFELLTYLKESGNATPVIVLSNLNQEDDIRKVRELGAIEYFIKSNVSLNELITKIKTTLFS